MYFHYSFSLLLFIMSDKRHNFKLMNFDNHHNYESDLVQRISPPPILIIDKSHLFDIYYPSDGISISPKSPIISNTFVIVSTESSFGPFIIFITVIIMSIAFVEFCIIFVKRKT